MKYLMVIAMVLLSIVNFVAVMALAGFLELAGHNIFSTIVMFCAMITVYILMDKSIVYFKEN